MLKVSRLTSWMNKPYCKDIITSALKSLSNVYIAFFPIETTADLTPDSNQPPPATPLTGNSVNSERFFGTFFDDSVTVQPEARNETCRRFLIEKELETEITNFSDIISKPEIIRSYKSSNLFWKKYSAEMPKLRELYLLLSNIPSTSAYIERFFSITGLVCDKRRLQMSDDLIECRSMLKVNMSQVEELKYSCD